MHKTLIALAILSTTAAAHADEGMWMPQQLPPVSYTHLTLPTTPYV